MIFSMNLMLTNVASSSVQQETEKRLWRLCLELSSPLTLIERNKQVREAYVVVVVVCVCVCVGVGGSLSSITLQYQSLVSLFSLFCVIRYFNSLVSLSSVSH